MKKIFAASGSIWNWVAVKWNSFEYVQGTFNWVVYSCWRCRCLEIIFLWGLFLL